MARRHAGRRRNYGGRGAGGVGRAVTAQTKFNLPDFGSSESSVNPMASTDRRLRPQMNPTRK